MFMRLEDGGTLLVEASWAAHRADGDEFGITLYGTEGGAELIVDDYAPSASLKLFGDNAARPATTRCRAPGGGHPAVVAEFVERSAPGTGGARRVGAAALARVVDACYHSAAPAPGSGSTPSAAGYGSGHGLGAAPHGSRRQSA